MTVFTLSASVPKPEFLPQSCFTVLCPRIWYNEAEFRKYHVWHSALVLVWVRWETHTKSVHRLCITVFITVFTIAVSSPVLKQVYPFNIIFRLSGLGLEEFWRFSNVLSKIRSSYCMQRVQYVVLESFNTRRCPLLKAELYYSHDNLRTRFSNK
jgi:hypothetical protein